jgi:NitT/TauT family transport system permease protein
LLSVWLAPKEPIPRWVSVAAGAFALGALLTLWSILTYVGLVDPLFLPAPSAVLAAFVDLAAKGSLWQHITASCSVVLAGFILASVIAVPIGIVTGSFALVRAFVEPVVNFMRYIPVSAMIPLLILWIGIGFEARMAVIFIGAFFQQIILVSDVSAQVSRDLIDASYTLGADRRQVVFRVLVPATLPGVLDALRVTLGWAWTYVVLAELLAASEGLGFMILNSMRGLFTDRIFVGMIVIGLLGLSTDQGFKYLHRWLLPWSPKAIA